MFPVINCACGCYALQDVRGCDEAKEELKEVVEFLKNPGGGCLI